MPSWRNRTGPSYTDRSKGWKDVKTLLWRDYDCTHSPRTSSRSWANFLSSLVVYLQEAQMVRTIATCCREAQTWRGHVNARFTHFVQFKTQCIHFILISVPPRIWSRGNSVSVRGQKLWQPPEIVCEYIHQPRLYHCSNLNTVTEEAILKSVHLIPFLSPW